MSVTMTNQAGYTNVARTVDEGAIYELAFTYRWNKPAPAYALTKAMAEKADYTDPSFTKVVIRETGEVMGTRKFKREFRDLFPRTRNPLAKKTSGLKRFNVWFSGYNEIPASNTYYTIKYYISTDGETMRLTMQVIETFGKASETVAKLTGKYDAESYDKLVAAVQWFMEQKYDFSILCNYKAQLMKHFSQL